VSPVTHIVLAKKIGAPPPGQGIFNFQDFYIKFHMQAADDVLQRSTKFGENFLKIGSLLDDPAKVVFSPTIKKEKIGLFLSLFLHIKTMHACKFP